MRLSSSAFADGGAIPRRFTCDGEDASPPLAWADVPSGARSLALLCDDPDASAGTWHHWAIYDIPVDRTGLADNADRNAAQMGFKKAINDFRNKGYNGPCPPRRHGPHHYHFRLLALSTASLTLRDEPNCRDVEREARKHVLSEATLVGIYQR
jgi:Raf kinase inhibitor-like YbhB/YbcL family protein